MRKNGVRCLLMGGQACVFYGAAEFSRDLDLVVLLDSSNLEALQRALNELDAVPIAILELDAALLRRGHAVHFRCRRDDVQHLRVDIMSHPRGVAPFAELWERRTTIDAGGVLVDLLSLPDLVAAKKTQRDKDWPMIRRLVERSYFATSCPSSEMIQFWQAELRTPELLTDLVRKYPEAAARSSRPAVQAALRGTTETASRLTPP